MKQITNLPPPPALKAAEEHVKAIKASKFAMINDAIKKFKNGTLLF
jgi:hypothetical protein